MVTNVKNRYFLAVFVVLFILMTQGFKYSYWTSLPFLPKFRYAVLLLIPLFTLCKYRNVVLENIMYNRKNVLYFIFACILTFLLRNVFYDSGLGHGLEMNIFMSSVFCSYFLFYYASVSEKNIIKAITIIGLIVFVIQVFQQLYPSLAVFSIITEEQRFEMGISSDYMVGMRNGIYRFIPVSQALPVFLSCYYFSKLLKKFSALYLLLTLIFLTSMYLMLTRMFIVCTGICFVYIYASSFNVKRSNFSILIVSLGAIVMGIYYSDALFSSLFSSGETGLDYSAKARIECVPFLLTKAFDDPLLFILGHGYPNLLWDWGNKWGYWYSDVGIIGQIYIYGIVWPLVYMRLVYCFLVKMRHQIPCYIRAYIFGMFCICYMMPSYGLNLELTLLWCIVLYISDLYISNSNQTDNNLV